MVPIVLFLFREEPHNGLRRRCLLCLPEDTRVELALDKGTLYRGRRSAPFCEVELELKQGSFAHVEVLARRLSQKYGLVEEPLSKFQQTMRL